MPSTTSAAADKAGVKTATDKVHEKVIEKRRALGRGLESLLPGPRVVTPPVAPQTSAATAPPATAAVPAASGRIQPTEDADHARSNEGVEVQKPREGPGDAGAVAPLSMTTIPGLQAAEGADARSLQPIDSSSSEDLRGGADVAAAPRSEGQPGTTVLTPPGTAGASSSFSRDEVLRLDLDLIDDNPHQTRRTFREDNLRELGESIRVQGVLQPIVVRESGEGRYKLILGERRLRASRLAGIETIPAIVKRVNEQQAAEMTLVENLQRQDLNCIEQAEAFAKLSQEFHLTQEQIGARVGLSREAVSNYMRLLSLPEGVVEALIGGRLTFSHARVLLQLKSKDPVSIWYYAKKAIDNGMTVKRFEDFVYGKFSLPDDRPPADRKNEMAGGARWVDPNVKAAQRSLEEVLGMRVRIRDRAGRGKIVIDYNTVDDFQRVVGMLKGE